MAGRRWAQGAGEEPGRKGGAKPRPSERRGAGQPAPREPDRTREISAEAMARAHERMNPPKAPWHPLPLAELAIVLGFLVILVSAIFTSNPGITAGFLLCVLGTGEFSLREHRHGYRSHATVLALLLGAVVGIACWQVLDLHRNACIIAAVVVFLLAWASLDRSYVPMRERRAPAGAADPGSTAEGGKTP